MKPSPDAPPIHGLASEAGSWLQALSQTTSVAIFLYRDTYLYANPATERLTGYTADELRRMAIWEVAHPDHRELVRQRAEARLRGESAPPHYEVKLLTKRGDERWVDFAAAAVMLDGEPAGMGTAYDITERKTAELALRDSEERLKLAQAAAGTVIWDWELATDQLTVHPYARQLFGLDIAALARTGKEFLALVHPEDRDLLLNGLHRVLKQGENLTVEVRFVTPSGEVRWVAERARALREPSGWVPRIIGVAHDITERKRAEIALRDSEEKYRLIVEQQSDLVVQTDGQGRIVYLSPSVGAYFGRSSDESLGRHFVELATESERAPARRAWEQLHRPPHAVSFENRVLLQGRVRWLSWAARAVLDGDGNLTEVVAVGRDITERKLAEDALFQEKERAQVTLASIGDGVVRTDASGLVDYLNPVAEALTGWRLAEAYGRPVKEIFGIVDADTRAPLGDTVSQCLREVRTVAPPGNRLLLRPDGAEFAVRDSASPIRSRRGDTVGAVLVFKDVTELRGMEREMTYLASYDPLTGLLNRRAFEQRLERALAAMRDEGRPAALCYLDLDEFKVINDTCGHVAGDEMLKQIAALLQWRVPERVSLARLGGDEFGVLIEDRAIEEARQVAEALHREVTSFRFTWHGRTFETHASIGLVPIGSESTDLHAVLSAADAACYVAKEAGRNRIHEYQPDDTALAERYGEMQWIHRIHSAFDQDRFVLYQQEIRPLTGASMEPMREIFIRMVDEEGQLVPPVAFIPAAERYHLIPAIDRWVVTHALEVLAAGPPSPETFTINLSGQSLTQEGFLEFVAERLRATGLHPSRLCFEITETAAIANLTRAVAFISALKEMGCRFVLDDFGSGMSSFAYLKNLPIDFLKIDGEFVRDLLQDPIHLALVGSINQIGHVLGLRTIAEAVEDEGTLGALRGIGVDYAQGYWIARPQPLEMR